MRLIVACLVSLLAACDDRRSFDQQYDQTANEIENRAARIEADLNSTTTEPDVGAESASRSE